MSMAAPNPRMIELVEVGRAYTRADGQAVTAVDRVSLTVPEGEFVCLIGPSGCGKSTLLQMIAGLTEPSSGAIVVDGKEIDGPGRRARHGVPARQRVPVDAGHRQCRIRPQVPGRRRQASAAWLRSTTSGGSGSRMSSAPGRANSRAAC